MPKTEQFQVVFTDRKNKNFRREYHPHITVNAKEEKAETKIETIAKQWSEKQRDVWCKHYDYSGKGSEFLNDPRTWLVKVVPMNQPAPAKEGKKKE